MAVVTIRVLTRYLCLTCNRFARNPNDGPVDRVHVGCFGTFVARDYQRVTVEKPIKARRGDR